MGANWRFVKLKDIDLTIIDGDRGNNYPKADEFTDDGFCLFLSAKNITKNGFRLNEKQFISEEKDNLLRKGKLKDLDIIITTRGSVGHIAYNENIQYTDMRINSGMVIVRNNDENINQKYIYKLFASNVIQRQIEKIAFGSAQPQLTVKEIKNLQIPLPPLKEQEKIADILSTADDKIDAIASQIQKAETLKKGLLQKLLSEGIGHSKFKDSELGKIPESWEVVRLKTCSELIKDGTHGSHKDTENGIPLLSAKDIKNGKVILDVDSRKISLDDFNKIHKNYSLTNDDLLLTVVGTLGRVALIKDYNNNYTFQRSVAIVRLLKTNSPQYFYHIFTSLFFQKQLILHSNASAQAGVYLGELEKLKIPLPPIKEQKQIAEILSTADEKLEVLRAKKQMYETLKIGLLQKLLSGEVRV